LELNL